MSSPRQKIPPLTEQFIQQLADRNKEPALSVYNMHLEQNRISFAKEYGVWEFVNALVRKLKTEKEQDHGKPG
ncbi:hypothetical protein LCGC14_1515000 [marine sediment metagenome]|uniref:Uncharacterized protein n=1 Tax=marine sediment metagenome TaxID=412755 RepID=A0A0F9M1F3_9ZZZZ